MARPNYVFVVGLPQRQQLVVINVLFSFVLIMFGPIAGDREAVGSL